jgi:hypothetical protein
MLSCYNWDGSNDLCNMMNVDHDNFGEDDAYD